MLSLVFPKVFVGLAATQLLCDLVFCPWCKLLQENDKAQESVGSPRLKVLDILGLFGLKSVGQAAAHGHAADLCDWRP